MLPLVANQRRVCLRVCLVSMAVLVAHSLRAWMGECTQSSRMWCGVMCIAVYPCACMCERMHVGCWRWICMSSCGCVWARRGGLRPLLDDATSLTHALSCSIAHIEHR
jgi:hypothetical protein